MDQSPPPPPAAARQLAELERLFQTHHGAVMRAAYRVTGNATDAEDVLQTVFIRLLSRRADSAPMENAPAYLRRAAVNTALDLVRGRREGKQISIDAQAARWPAAADAAPDRQQETREMRGLIRRAIAHLPPQMSEIFALHYFEGYSNPEIATLLDLSAAGVAVTLHRARTRLEQEIRSFMGERS